MLINNNSLVSIGLPVFNEEKSINRALESLISQTYSNLEINISDNCSTDNTVIICQSYAKKDRRISININKENLGVSENFRIAFKISNGKYFMLASGDDYWRPEFIETLVNEMESHPTSGAAFCAVRIEMPDGTFVVNTRFTGNDNPNELSNWKIAAKLLSPNRKIKSKKYPLFMYSLFRKEALSEIFAIEKDIFNFGDRAFLSLVTMKYRFSYVDKILFTKTQQEKFSARHPNDKYHQKKREMGYFKYYFRYYYKLMIFTNHLSDINLKNRLFCINFIYWVMLGYIQKIKKRMKKFI